MIGKYFVLSVLIGVSVLSCAVSGEPSSVDRAFLKRIPGWLTELKVPAVGIGIIERGELTSVQVFGELQKGRSAPKNTLFNIASQTKAVIGIMVLELVASGKWNLDEPLCHYWIDPDIAGDPRHKLITTRHVLSHQTGFMNWRVNHPSGRLRFDFDPGTQFQYSGEGFEYLARALENKFNTSLDVLLQKVLLRPLKMRDTQYWNTDLDVSRLARWHNANGEPYAVSHATQVKAADDLISTVSDYCRLCLFATEGLPPAIYRDMVRSQVEVKKGYHRALGWGLVNGLPDGEYALEHGGSDMGVRTMAVFLPLSKRGIVIMTNGDNGILLIDRVIRASLNVGDQLLDQMNQPANIPKKIHLSATIIDRYVGVYRQPNARMIRIVREGEGIKVSGEGIPTATLVPQSESQFFWPNYDVRLEFEIDTSDGLMHMRIIESGNLVMDTAKQGR